MVEVAFVELKGRTFGRLEVIERAYKSFWTCRCECGNFDVIQQANLLHGQRKSCGCARQEWYEKCRANVPRSEVKGTEK